LKARGRVVLLRCLVGLWLGLLGLAAGAEPTPELRIAVSKGPVSLAILVAQQNGLFEREGVKVKLLDCASGRECYALLASGQAQIATAADVVATLNSFTRDDLAFIATISASSHQIKLLARKSTGIGTPLNVKGKRIGTVAGSSAQYFLHSWLLFHDISPAEVHVVPLPPDQIVGALQRREVDAVAIWEPVAGAALQALGEDGLVMPNPRVYTQHFGLVTTRATLAADGPAMQRVLRALIGAEAAIAAQPVKAADILAARLGITPAQANALAAEHDYRIRLDQALMSTMSAQRRWVAQEGMDGLAKKGSVTAPLPKLTVEPSLLRQVAPGAVSVAY
jgi:NitT/TauT family transport system substrate-binding protein